MEFTETIDISAKKFIIDEYYSKILINPLGTIDFDDGDYEHIFELVRHTGFVKHLLAKSIPILIG